MRDPARIPRILELLREFWEKYPDMRFGQLVVNLSVSYYMEDSDTEKVLKLCLGKSEEI